MAVDVVMPRLSDSMEEGTVLRWLKAVGDEVKRGDELVEIETDKANMTYEASDEGTLIEILAEEGATLPIGEAIARIGEQNEQPSGTKPPDGSQAGPAKRDSDQEPESRPRQATAAPPRPAPPSNGDGRVKASPVARRMARDLNVRLDAIAGSGPG